MPKKRYPISLIHVVILFLQNCQACTVWKMGNHGLASAANNLFLAFPVFYGTNGTFFLDNRDFSYSCSQTEGWQNGWHDFFITDDVINWKPEHERDFGDVCVKMELDGVIPLVREVGLSYNDLQMASALKVISRPLWPSSSPPVPLLSTAKDFCTIHSRRAHVLNGGAVRVK